MGKFCANPPGFGANYYQKAFTSQNAKVWGDVPSVYVADHVDKELIFKAFGEWSDYAGRALFTVSDNPIVADIRVGFVEGDGSWSYVGTDSKSIGRAFPTMNIGWSLRNDYATALHEVGHALGLGHEHQNPGRLIQFDRARTLAYFGTSPNNWSSATIQAQIFDVWDFDNSKVWDSKSVMHYGLPGRVISSPSPYSIYGVTGGQVLSAGDAAWVVDNYGVQVVDPVEETEEVVDNPVAGSWFMNNGEGSWVAADVASPELGGIYTYIQAKS